MTILFLIIAYLLGSIPFGLWIGQLFFHKDIRQLGSGNTGTTNTFRILGAKAGLMTFILDFFKGTIAVLLPTLFHLNGVYPLIFGLLAILGHIFPIFAKFKGGKAIATSAGVLLGFQPLFLLYLLIIFIISIYLTSMVSFASLSVVAFALLGIALFPAFHFIFSGYDWLFSLLIIGLALVIILRHRSNIIRIKNHVENTVPFGLNLTHQKKTD